MRDVLETAGALVGLALGICALTGVVANWIVKPWIQTHVVAPVKETNRQVSQNGYADPGDPTLKDSIHTLQTQYRDLRSDIAAAAFMFDGHIAASERDRGDLWSAVRELRGDPPTLEPTHRKDDPL